MKLFAGLCSSLLLVFSSVGCCCMSSCVGSCDPCGRELCGGGLGGGCSSCGSKCGGCGCGLGGCLSKLFHHRCHKCHPMYAGYGWDAYSGCGDVCYDGCNTTYGMASPGCGCGVPNGMPPAPMVPPAQPAPIPAAIDPMGARMPIQRTMVTQAPQQPAPQQVSYEEFQRLPGTMVSAPQAPAAAPMVPPVQR
jgi:hypothetical protein